MGGSTYGVPVEVRPDQATEHSVCGGWFRTREVEGETVRSRSLPLAILGAGAKPWQH